MYVVIYYILYIYIKYYYYYYVLCIMYVPVLVGGKVRDAQGPRSKTEQI